MNESFAETFLKATKPVRYAAAAALGVLALFLLALTINAFGNLGRSTNPYMNTITVEGTGKGTSIPNLAVISFSVSEQGATVAEAQGKATEKTDAALSAVSGLAIDEKDVKTIAYNVYPRYENTAPCYSGYCPTSNPKIIGYEVSQTVEVKVRDTAKAGDVLQALGTLNVQNISGPNFTVDEDDAIKNVAREEAIKEAKAKAKALADELGVSLGKVVSFYETPAGGMPYYGYGGEAKAMDMAVQSAPSLPTGENETSITVSITYEIR
ncbi:MAG TPA: SIMPL domain-containing protein [Candidatus Paceibacterota bacterium]|nr:SIMPL domain-containing protein [Candidatus Paceibacterota bacterium]